ncbi:methionine--tRNA ligase subunit beta [Patescibacteria group bacterium]
MVSFEDFKKINIRVGKILSAEKVPETDRLLKLEVNFSEENPRTIVSGIAEHFSEEKDLIGKKVAFVTNLEPRKIRGVESNGMILAVSDNENFSLLEVDNKIPAGSIVG